MSDHTVAFDHLIHWVHDLDAARAAYIAAGLPTRPALTMPGFRNAAWGVDDERYVELAAVQDWDAVAASEFAGSLTILRPAVAALAGPGLLSFAVDVPDARVSAARLRAAGRAVEVVEVRLAEQNAGFTEVFVRDVPPWFPFLITYDPPRAELARMRAAHRESEGMTVDARPDLIALLIRSTKPDAEARKLGEFLGCSVEGRTVALPGAQVRFTEGVTPGLHGVVVRGLDPATVPAEVAGMAFVER